MCRRGRGWSIVTATVFTEGVSHFLFTHTILFYKNGWYFFACIQLLSRVLGSWVGVRRPLRHSRFPNHVPRKQIGVNVAYIYPATVRCLTCAVVVYGARAPEGPGSYLAACSASDHGERDRVNIIPSCAAVPSAVNMSASARRVCDEVLFQGQAYCLGIKPMKMMGPGRCQYPHARFGFGTCQVPYMNVSHGLKS